MTLAMLLLAAALAQTPTADPAPPLVRRDAPALDDPKHAAQTDPAQEGAGGTPAPAPIGGDRVADPSADGAVPALTWDGEAPPDAASLEALLATFAAAYPQTFRRVNVAPPGAPPVWIATVTRAPDAPPEALAALSSVLYAPLATAEPASELARTLNACAGLLERASRDALLAERLAKSAVHFLVTPDAERAFAPGAARTALDFPSGWSRGPSGAAHPLASPSTRALASFLLAHPSIACCAAPRGPVLDAQGAQPFARVADEPAKLPGGSLERFVGDYLGAPLFALALPGADDVAAARERAGETLAALLAELPRVNVASSKLERARPDLWILDLVVENAGALATLEAPATRREGSSLWGEIAGAELVAVASARDAEPAPLEPLAFRAKAFDLGHLGGRETRRLRIVLRGVEGAKVELALRSLRAGSASLALELR